MPARLAMVTLVVPSYEDGVAFTCGVLGWELVEDTPLEPPKRWVVVRPGPDGADVLLARAATDAQRARAGDQTGGRVAFFLHTDDCRAEHARLSAAGVHFTSAPRVEEYGTVAVFADPWGNLWDLIGR